MITTVGTYFLQIPMYGNTEYQTHSWHFDVNEKVIILPLCNWHVCNFALQAGALCYVHWAKHPCIDSDSDCRKPNTSLANSTALPRTPDVILALYDSTTKKPAMNQQTTFEILYIYLARLFQIGDRQNAPRRLQVLHVLQVQLEILREQLRNVQIGLSRIASPPIALAVLRARHALAPVALRLTKAARRHVQILVR